MSDYAKYLRKYAQPVTSPFKKPITNPEVQSTLQPTQKTQKEPVQAVESDTSEPVERNRVLEYHRLSQFAREQDEEQVLYAGSQGLSIMYRKKEEYRPLYNRARWSV